MQIGRQRQEPRCRQVLIVHGEGDALVPRLEQ